MERPSLGGNGGMGAGRWGEAHCAAPNGGHVCGQQLRRARWVGSERNRRIAIVNDLNNQHTACCCNFPWMRASRQRGRFPSLGSDDERRQACPTAERPCCFVI